MRGGAYWFCVMMCLRVQIWNSVWGREKKTVIYGVSEWECVCMRCVCVYVYQGKWWCLCTGSMVWFLESVQMNCWLVQKVLTSSERVRDNQEHIHLLWGTHNLFFYPFLCMFFHPSIHPLLYITVVNLYFTWYFYFYLYYYYSRVWGHKVFYVHQDCIYLIKNTVKTVTLWNSYNLNNCYLFLF